MKQQLLLSLAILAIYLPFSFAACPSGFSKSGNNCIKWFHGAKIHIKNQCNQAGGTTSFQNCEYIGGSGGPRGGGGLEIPRIDINDIIDKSGILHKYSHFLSNKMSKS